MLVPCTRLYIRKFVVNRFWIFIIYTRIASMASCICARMRYTRSYSRPDPPCQLFRLRYVIRINVNKGRRREKQTFPLMSFEEDFCSRNWRGSGNRCKECGGLSIEWMESNGRRIKKPEEGRRMRCYNAS